MRSFCLVSIVFLSQLVPVLADANSDSGLVLHLVCTSGDKNSPQGKSSQLFSERVLENSNGRISVNVFYQNELGGQQELFDQLLKGNVHFMLEWPMTSYDQRMAVNFVPYLVLDWEDAIQAYSSDGWLQRLLSRIFAENGLKYLGPYPEGFGGIATKGRYATNTEDAKGLKVRSQTIFPLPQTMNVMGFEAVPIDWSEVYTSIQTGVVDGDSSNVIYWYYEYFGDQLDYFVHSKHTFAASVLLMNNDTWMSLKKADQRAIEEAAEFVIAKQFRDAKTEDEKWIRIAQEDGMEYIVPTQEETAAWIEQVRGQVWPLVEQAYGEDVMREIRKNASVPEL
ncbi:MAG: TRAP transporter substrate-binding protein DctP [Pseudomonadota bacterium]